MTAVKKYSISIFLVLLVIAYSTPINTLHSCRNLKHHSEQTHIEESHPHCFLCNLSFNPYIPSEAPVYLLSLPASVEKPIAFEVNKPVSDTPNTELNKGPPVLS